MSWLIKKFLGIGNQAEPQTDQAPEESMDNFQRWNARYYRSRHWEATKKLFRSKMPKPHRCFWCGITDDEHREEFGFGVDVHHRSHEFIGCERWCDLEMLCRKCNDKDRAGDLHLPETPSIASTDFIHPCDPEPDYPAEFGWWTKEERDRYTAAEAQRVQNQPPLELSHTAAPASSPVASPEPIRARELELEQERQRISERQEARLGEIFKQLEHDLDEYAKQYYQAYRDALRDLRDGLISPHHMHRLMARYQGNCSAKMDQIVEKENEIQGVCPTYRRVSKERLRKKREEIFGKTNGQDVAGVN